MGLIRKTITESTMLDAAALAAEGAPHGTTVVAQRQTAGVGRFGRKWSSDDEGGLYLSMVLRLPNAGPSLTLALGLAVQEAINEVAGQATDLRWPNDVLLNEKKVAGILVQATDGALIAGIGLNVNQKAFAPELSEIATSLYLSSGRPHDPERFLARIRTLTLHYSALSRPEILRRFEQASTYARGKLVEADGLSGITNGLDPNGFLLVRTEAGIRTITAGGVRPSSGTGSP